MIRLNIGKWRRLHRWAGLLLSGFILLYCITGVMLNHRKSFNYFTVRHQQTFAVEVQQQDALNKFIDSYKQQIGRDDDPAVIRIRDGGTVEFLYGSHGRTTYIIDSAKGVMVRIDKQEQQPWYWLNSLHKSLKTSLFWVLLTDGVALLILFLTLSGLIIFRYTRLDLLLLIIGVLLMLFGMALA
ncbi:MAG: PepSY-associated TM helix domain-containing protein [Candidatus Electrothrix sp. YB6]